jgi:branched-chain amino acid transport system substrate-binding protein
MRIDWLDVRRDRPDWIYLQGWGAMNPTALKEASKVGFPMSRLVGVGGRRGRCASRRRAGRKATLRLISVASARTSRQIQDILKYVVDKGRSQVASKDKVGENVYKPRRVMNAVLITEAIRAAQRLTDKKQVSGDDVRRGLETLSITDARWKELGLPHFAAPIHLSCSDHNGHRGIYLVEWDGTKWTRASGWIEPIKDKVLPLIDSAASSYVGANTGWPKRTEACDKSS